MTVTEYHAHVYFNDSNIHQAKILIECIREEFNVNIGRMHEKTVGPHPVWSCGIEISKSEFEKVYAYLLLNHEEFSVLIHPVTGDDMLDHTKFAM